MTAATDEELAELLGPDPVAATSSVIADRRDRPRFKPWTYDEYLTLPEIPWLIGDRDRPVLISKGLWVTFGLYKSGKTYWELEKAFCVAFGIEFHGLPVTQGRIAYVCAEGDVKRIFERLVALCAKHELDPGAALNDGRFNLITSAVNLTVVKGVDSVEELLKQLSASGDGTYIAVWLDTWAQMLAASGGHDSDADFVMPAVRGCVRIREALGCTVTIVAHVGVSEKAQDRPKGLSDLPGAVDGGTKSEKEGEGPSAIFHFKSVIQRHAADGYEQLARLIECEPDNVMQRIGRREVARAKLSTDQQRCLDILRGLGDGTSVEAWRDAVREDGVWKDLKNWRSKWKDELDKLVAGDWIEKGSGTVSIND
jgi:AAA domain